LQKKDLERDEITKGYPTESHDTGHMWEEISPQPVLTRFMRLQKEF
jgi:hypothetical protein